MAQQAAIASIVEEAANKINLCPDKLNDILDRLRAEYISQSWQLESVSNEQWKAMGAPIGFVISLHTCFPPPSHDHDFSPHRKSDKRRSGRRHSLREGPAASRRQSSRDQNHRRKSTSVQPSKRDLPRQDPQQSTKRDSPRRDSPRKQSPKKGSPKHHQRESPRTKDSHTRDSPPRKQQQQQHPHSPESPSPSLVERNPETGRLCYVSRGKIIYEWEESFDSVVLVVPKPGDIDMSDVICSIGENSIRIGSKSEKTSFFSRPTGGAVIPGKSSWVPYGGMDVKGIIVTLAKANQGSEWKRPILPPIEGSLRVSQSVRSLCDYLDSYHTDTESFLPVNEPNGKKSPSVESLERKAALRRKLAEEVSVDRSKNHSLASQETQPVHNGGRAGSRRSLPIPADDDDDDDDGDSFWTIKKLSPDSNDREEALVDDSSLLSRWSRRAKKGANRKFWTPPNKKKSKEPGTHTSSQKNHSPRYRTSFAGSIDPIDSIIPAVPFTDDNDDEEEEEMNSVLTDTPAGEGPIIYFSSKLGPSEPMPCGSDHSMSTISTMGSRSTIRTILSTMARRSIPEPTGEQDELVDEETYDMARRSSKSLDEFNMVVHHYSRPQEELNNSLRTFARSLDGSLADVE